MSLRRRLIVVMGTLLGLTISFASWLHLGVAASVSFDISVVHDVKINGVVAGDKSGVGVAAGDMNNDGIADLVVGATGVAAGGAAGECLEPAVV